ncbi:MAG: hypothetical protein J0I93_11995 [Legionella sp.]|nr:hypothetical protein [Legionella sp.]
MTKQNLGALVLAMASATSFAGSMGDVVTPERLLLIEGGVSYSHNYYSDRAFFAESINSFTPAGYVINPNDFYPNDFFGGYIGASVYFPSDWLTNFRYDMYGKKRNTHHTLPLYIDFAPVRLSFTVDKVFGDFRAFSFGVGGGAVVETLNEGNYVNYDLTRPPSESLQGRTRIDPLVEGFAMYRFANNFGVKFNLAYQIPVNNKFSNGDLNLNLGLNYAFPI